MADPPDDGTAARGAPAERGPAGDASNPYQSPTRGEPSPGTAATLAGDGRWREKLLAQHPWVAYVLPLIVFMVVGSFEPGPPKAGAVATGSLHYPILYSIKIALTVAAIGLVWPVYRQFPFRINPLAVVVGIVGVVLWIWLCQLDLERKWLQPIGLGGLLGLGERTGYNPFEQLGENPAALYGFLAVRFFGLAIVIAAVEEFFLRGFLMRFYMDPAWWEVPFGKVNATALAIGTLVPVLMHPAELFAAAAWFSLITCLMVTTRNIWDCITAHAVTNLLLGAYIVWDGRLMGGDSWYLW